MLINNEEHNDLCVGIDLGTTNSVLATVNLKANGDIVSKVVDLPRAVDVYNSAAGKARLNTQKKPLLPSCVYYREEHSYEPLVGDFAKNQYALRPHLVAKSIKSQMGSAYAEGLADEIMDKTPAQVSARILQHMLREASKIYRTEIKDAVITVPANFDSVMCQATRDAAALAGIQVTNKDGSERPVLLSEPNAVIYNLINQVQNGEISNHIIDLNSEKNVLVFDLGGGTLDITMHKIKRREDCPDVLKVDEIATNRYTLLGGDDFDRAIADVMFEHYQKQYSTSPMVVRKLQQEKNIHTGTTMSLFMLVRNYYFIIQVGDSRVYLYREKRLHQLTVDASTTKLKNGRMKQYLNNYLGKSDELWFSCENGEILPQDIFVICSDGFYHYFSENDMRQYETMIRKKQRTNEVCDILINTMMERGERDNISVGFVTV